MYIKMFINIIIINNNITFYDNWAYSIPTPRSLLFFTILNQLLTTKD